MAASRGKAIRREREGEIKALDSTCSRFLWFVSPAYFIHRAQRTFFLLSFLYKTHFFPTICDLKQDL